MTTAYSAMTSGVLHQRLALVTTRRKTAELVINLLSIDNRKRSRAADQADDCLHYVKPTQRLEAN